MKEKKIGIIIYTIILMLVFGLALAKTRRDCEVSKQAAVEAAIKEASNPTISDIKEKASFTMRNNEVEVYTYEDLDKHITYAVIIRNGEIETFVETSDIK